MAELSLNNFVRSFIIFACVVSGNTEQCYEQSLCLCKLNDNHFIDLSKVVTKDNPYLIATSTTDNNVTFIFDPCDRDFDVNNLHIKKPNPTGGCDSSTSLCMYNEINNTLTSLGTFESRRFSSGEPSTEITFSNNPNVTILVVCVPEDLNLFKEISSTNRYVFGLFSSHVCPQHGYPGLSMGSKLLIMFGTGFAIYLIGGALVLHFLRGARGKEVIPNVDFWTSLPGLVKDGFVYILSGCHPTSISTAEAYDRI